MIRALVFDFDGTMIDTETPDYIAWRDIYADHGCELTEETWCQNIGLGAASVLFHPFETLQALTGQTLDEARIRARRRERYLAHIHAQPILPGVENVIMEAKNRGLKLAVASSSDCPWVRGHLERLHLFHYFDAIRCADDVEHTKPHPELYLAAINALGVLPHEAIAIEDSAHGVTSAKAAGLYAVAIPNAMTHRMPLGHADLRLTSLADIPLPDLLRQLTQNETHR